MKRLALSLVLLSLISSFCFAADLAGKWGFGARSDSFSVRRFFTNGFAGDIYLDQFSGTQTGASDISNLGIAVAGVFVNEIAANTLLEYGATVGQSSGTYSTGINYTGLYINPFVGGEYLLGDHFGIDFKVILAGYSCEMSGTTRTTYLTGLTSSMGAHIYF